MEDGRDVTIFTLKQRKMAVICDYRRGQSLTTLLGWGAWIHRIQGEKLRDCLTSQSALSQSLGQMPGLGHVTEKAPTCNSAEEEEKGRKRRDT